jgi:hypothetical protein
MELEPQESGCFELFTSFIFYMTLVIAMIIVLI